MRFKFACFGLPTAWLICAYAAQAQSTVKLSPASLHSDLSGTATGAGFGDREAIDVYLDTSDTALTVSSATGTFSISVLVPANAAPGAHYITAIGRKSGDAAQASFTVTSPWPQTGFGVGGRAWNPWENTLGQNNVGTLGLLWSQSTDPVYSGPVISGGRVYVASPTGLKSLRASTGQVAWTNSQIGLLYGPPAFSGTSIFVASDNDGISAVNTLGTKLWNALSGVSFTYAAPVVASGVVYVGDSTGNMYALNANTGAVLWTTPTGGEAIQSAAAVVDGYVYVGSYSGTVYALNASSGAVVWSYATAAQIRAQPAVVNGVVYIGSFDSYLYALVAEGPSGGQLLWRAETDDNIWSAVAVADGSVFETTANGVVYAYQPRTGALKWSTGFSDYIYTDVSVANGVLYVGSNSGTLYALNDTNGTVLWTAVLDGQITGRPAVSDGVVYVNSQGGKTFAFALQAGNNATRPMRRAPAISTLRPDYRLRVQTSK